jgi:hypothetical protein
MPSAPFATPWTRVGQSPPQSHDQSRRTLQPGPLCRARTRLHPDPRQAEVLDSWVRRGILNCSRQWGKSTVIAAQAVNRAYTDPGSLTLILSPCGRQSSMFLAETESLGRYQELLASCTAGVNRLTERGPRDRLQPSDPAPQP